MKINHIIWAKVKIKAIKPSKKWTDLELDNCSISYYDENKNLIINQYSSSQGVSTGKHVLLGKVKLITLESWGVIFEAKAFNTKFLANGKAKTEYCPVKVHAEF